MSIRRLLWSGHRFQPTPAAHGDCANAPSCQTALDGSNKMRSLATLRPRAAAAVCSGAGLRAEALSTSRTGAGWRGRALMPEPTRRRSTMTAEERRLQEVRERTAHWRRWGPYLADRQWG